MVTIMIEETDFSEIDVSRPLAPEDVRPGDYIAVATEIFEHLPCHFGRAESVGPPAPLRVAWTPCDAGAPYRVSAVCLPFVLAQDADGAGRTLDVRRHRLVRLTERYGKKAFKRLRTARPPHAEI